MSKLLTPQEVAEILSLKYRKILELIHHGKLKAIQIDKSFRVTEYDLHDFIEKNWFKSH